MNAKHTPGPWTVGISGRRGAFTVSIPEAAAHEFENANDGVDGFTVSNANRHLIAAAPDLLDACRVVVNRFGGCLNDVLNPCWDGRATDVIGRHWGSTASDPVDACAYCHARAAIAKAEGRS